MRRLLYLIPATGFDAKEIDRRRLILNSFASEGTTVDVCCIENGPMSVESFYDECMAIPDTLRLVRKASEEKYDAIIIGCYGDPGIQAAREIVATPVIGPGETSMVIACLLGCRFSILTILQSMVGPLRELSARVGVSDKLASIRSVGIPVLELARREDLMKRLIQAGRQAKEEDDADVLVLGCMTMAFLDVSRKLQDKLDIPVVNPAHSSVKMAETIVDMGLTHSSRAHRTFQAR